MQGKGDFKSPERGWDTFNMVSRSILAKEARSELKLGGRQLVLFREKEIPAEIITKAGICGTYRKNSKETM